MWFWTTSGDLVLDTGLIVQTTVPHYFNIRTVGISSEIQRSWVALERKGMFLTRTLPTSFNRFTNFDERCIKICKTVHLEARVWKYGPREASLTKFNCCKLCSLKVYRKLGLGALLRHYIWFRVQGANYHITVHIFT